MPTVNLTKHVRTPDGKRFLQVVMTEEGLVKPGWVMYHGRERHFPEGRYYLDYYDQDRKRRRLAVGDDAMVAHDLRLKKLAELETVTVRPKKKRVVKPEQVLVVRKDRIEVFVSFGMELEGGVQFMSIAPTVHNLNSEAIPEELLKALRTIQSWMKKVDISNTVQYLNPYENDGKRLKLDRAEDTQ